MLVKRFIEILGHAPQFTLMKKRLDQLLVSRGFVSSRTEAQKLIRAGLVRSHGHVLDKPGQAYPNDVALDVIEKEHPYVGRGGLKLQKAIEHFGLAVEGRIALDIGASTGGFTDCLLQSGAARVHAVDVGTNQLAWRLRNNERVIVYEQTNARHLKPEDIGEGVSCLAMDVSFISARLVLPAIQPMIETGGWGVVLVKPQFEAGPEYVGKGGIVRSDEVRWQCVRDVEATVVENGGEVLGVIESPITGAKGNVEFLLAWRQS